MSISNRPGFGSARGVSLPQLARRNVAVKRAAMCAAVYRVCITEPNLSPVKE